MEHHRAALRYALSVPGVACAVVGMKTTEELERNVEWAKQFTPLSEAERVQLDGPGKALAAAWKDHLGKTA